MLVYLALSPNVLYSIVTDETEVRQLNDLREWCFLNNLRSSFDTLETVYQGHRELQLSLVK